MHLLKRFCAWLRLCSRNTTCNNTSANTCNNTSNKKQQKQSFASSNWPLNPPLPQYKFPPPRGVPEGRGGEASNNHPVRICGHPSKGGEYLKPFDRLLSQAAVNTSIARDIGVCVTRIRLPSGEEIVLVEQVRERHEEEDTEGSA